MVTQKLALRTRIKRAAVRTVKQLSVGIVVLVIAVSCVVAGLVVYGRIVHFAVTGQ
jgi:hypothetical protein